MSEHGDKTLFNLVVDSETDRAVIDMIRNKEAVDAHEAINTSVQAWATIQQKIREGFTEVIVHNPHTGSENLVALPQASRETETTDGEDHEWYTPESIITRAKMCFGGSIDLDPASCDKANRMIRAEKYYTAENSGLDVPWQGNVFLSPPFVDPYISLFAGKLLEEWLADNIKSAIFMTNNVNNRRWFQKCLKTAMAFCFLRDKVQFYNFKGDVFQSHRPQVLFFFGKTTDDYNCFCQAFKDMGVITKIIRRW